MDIDVYQHCPCQSGKKIKFCCGKDVVHDLNEIVAKNKGGQPLAALSQLERVIEKNGPLNCLLTIQTHILISQGEIEKATASNDLYMKANPDESIGHQHKALIAVAEGNSRKAVEYLQDTMDSITGNQIPISVAHAFRLVGTSLFNEGHVLAARAHLQFATVLRGEADEELQQMVFQTFRVPEASILLKHDFRIEEPSEDKEWASKFTNVMRAMDRGQFRKALQFLERIDSQYHDEAIVVYAIAFLNTVLANLDTMASSWRRYSTLDGISAWDAVEAEALAQLFTVEAMTEVFDIVRVTYEVNDFELASNLAASSDRLAVLPALEEDPFGEGPAPRTCYYFLDRVKLDNAEELTLENVSSVAGEILIYGKQTDRVARIEWVATHNLDFDTFKTDVADIFKEAISGEPTEVALGKTTAISDSLSWNWHLPNGITKEQHAALIDQQRRISLLDGWAEIKFSILGDKSPREAAQDQEHMVALSALILHLESSADAMASDRSAATELRNQLGVPQLPSIDPVELGEAPISPIRQQYLDFEKLSDERLLQIHSEAMAIANISALRKIAVEVLSREHLDDRIPRDASLSMLAQMTEDDDKAFDYLQQARAVAKDAGRPLGIYLVQELDMRMTRGLTDKLSGLLQRIQAHHLSEPNVEYQLSRVLSRFGLLDQPPGAGPEMEPPESEEAAGGVWAADQENAAATDTVAEAPSENKLWLPGDG